MRAYRKCFRVARKRQWGHHVRRAQRLEIISYGFGDEMEAFQLRACVVCGYRRLLWQLSTGEHIRGNTPKTFAGCIRKMFFFLF